MNRNTFAGLTVCGALISALASSSVLAQGGGMMGHGMGGGCGMMGMGGGMKGGHGMMGLGPIWMLDLTAKQQTQIDKIHNDLRKQHWGVKRKMMDERNKLHELYGAEQRDAKKIGKVYGALFNLQRQMIETKIDAHNRMEAILTAEQREQLKQLRMDMPGRGMGPGKRGRMMGQ